MRALVTQRCCEDGSLNILASQGCLSCKPPLVVREVLDLAEFIDFTSCATSPVITALMPPFKDRYQSYSISAQSHHK